MNRALRLLLVVFAGVSLMGSFCEKVPLREWERGDFKPIGGREYSLPDGVEEGIIIGWDDEIPSSFLPLSMTLFNTTPERKTGIMPAGLVFSPGNSYYQYMILVQEFPFTVPPSGDTILLLPTYCCNEDLDEPDDESIYYMDIQVWEQELNEFFEILEGKSLVGDDPVDIVQEALFEITDYEGLSDTTKALLESLP